MFWYDNEDAVSLASEIEYLLEEITDKKWDAEATQVGQIIVSSPDNRKVERTIITRETIPREVKQKTMTEEDRRELEDVVGHFATPLHYLVTTNPQHRREVIERLRNLRDQKNETE